MSCLFVDYVAHLMRGECLDDENVSHNDQEDGDFTGDEMNGARQAAILT